MIRTPHGPLTRRAFTLVEVLLVLAIMGIMTLVSMPYLVKSIRGNRLRVATDTVVRAGRYARSMALLSQREMRLTFDISGSAIRVDPRYDTAPSAPTDTPPAGDAPPSDAAHEPPPVAADASNAPPAAAPSLSLARTLDAVRIDYVEVGHKDRETTGTVAVVYRSNGRCTPYAIRVVDAYGSATLTRVDALSTPHSERDDR